MVALDVDGDDGVACLFTEIYKKKAREKEKEEKG